MIERALRWADECFDLRSARLRYFNAAGADAKGRAGEDHDPETHLIPLVIDAALGRRPEIAVFGTDYPTPDGTCIRDYVHVEDLADAHIRALGALDGRSVTYNLGTGTGNSVLEVIRSVERVRRPQGPCRTWSDAAPATRRSWSPHPILSRRETGWTPRYAALDDIVRTAWAWREAHPHGYGQRTGIGRGVVPVPAHRCVSSSQTFTRRGFVMSIGVAATLEPRHPASHRQGRSCSVSRGSATTASSASSCAALGLKTACCSAGRRSSRKACWRRCGAISNICTSSITSCRRTAEDGAGSALRDGLAHPDVFLAAGRHADIQR